MKIFPGIVIYKLKVEKGAIKTYLQFLWIEKRILFSSTIFFKIIVVVIIIIIIIMTIIVIIIK